MDITKLNRNAERVKKALVRLGNKEIAKEQLTILIPKVFAKVGLIDFGEDIYIVGIYAIVTEDGSYACSNVPAKIRIVPTFTKEIKIGDIVYYAFVFESGATVIDNIVLEQDKFLIFPIFSDIIGRGRIPFQITYDDVGVIGANVEKYTGQTLMNRWEVLAILISMLARDPNNLNLQYRESLQSFKEVDEKQPDWRPIRKVQLMATNTINKIGGSYMSDGIIDALTTETTTVEPIEAILRE